MIIVGSCVADGGTKFRAVTQASLQAGLDPGDLVVTESGSTGIGAAYNRIIQMARETPDCELLLLLHDDVELLDKNFRAKLLLGAGLPRAGVLGVIGGRGLRGLEWWAARATAGAVFETRGYTDLGPRHAEVDCVDGLLMALTPAAFGKLDFDDVRFPDFHGYDVDVCLQARASGLRNFVVPVDLIHRTKGGYGDRPAFDAAAAALVSKWPQFVSPDPTWQAPLSRAKARARRVAAGATRRARTFGRRALGRSPVPQHALPQVPSRLASPGRPTPEHLLCPVCGEEFPTRSGSASEPQVLECPHCSLGVTWPPPSRDVETEELWEQMYGGERLQRRETWLAEARSRLDWVKLLFPEGMLLEVGCGTGEFLATAQSDGYPAYGVEPSKWAAARAEELGADVVPGYLKDWSIRYPGYRPDAVAMWHVLEHVPDPSALLSEIQELLPRGGRLFLEVPNYASTNARRLGQRWEGLQPEDHFHQFGPRSMRLLLARSGFEINQLLEISPRIYLSPDEWNRAKNDALVDLRPWPSLDYLRVSAVSR